MPNQFNRRHGGIQQLTNELYMRRAMEETQLEALRQATSRERISTAQQMINYYYGTLGTATNVVNNLNPDPGQDGFTGGFIGRTDPDRSRYDEIVDFIKHFLNTGSPGTHLMVTRSGTRYLRLVSMGARVLYDTQDNAFVTDSSNNAFVEALERLLRTRQPETEVESRMLCGGDNSQPILYYNFDRPDDVDDSQLIAQVVNERNDPRRRRDGDEEVAQGWVEETTEDTADDGPSEWASMTWHNAGNVLF